MNSLIILNSNKTIQLYWLWWGTVGGKANGVGEGVGSRESVGGIRKKVIDYQVIMKGEKAQIRLERNCFASSMETSQINLTEE